MVEQKQESVSNGGTQLPTLSMKSHCFLESEAQVTVQDVFEESRVTVMIIASYSC